MIELPIATSRRVTSPPPVVEEQPIDRTHLFRMTLGDRDLEREVLELFAHQSAILMARIASANPAGIAAIAHTLKGSARAIGAWPVARAAEAVELAAPGEREFGVAVAVLAAASTDARVAICDLLDPH